MSQNGTVIAGTNGHQETANHPGPLFRVGGLVGTERFDSASKTALLMDQADRLKLVPNYNILTEDAEVKIGIVVLQGVPPFQVTVSPFKPAAGDVLSRSWTTPGGETKSVELPAYAVKDVVEVGNRWEQKVRENHLVWARQQEGAIGIVASLVDADITGYGDLLSNCTSFLFCAAHKTGSSYLDPATTDASLLAATPIINEEGYPLQGGKASIPRMVLYQLDSVFTLQSCCQYQEKLLAGLNELKKQAGSNKEAWQHYFIVLAALCSIGVVIFKDQKRRGKDNQQKGYAVPDSVEDISRALQALIVEYREWDLEGDKQLTDPAIAKYYSKIDAHAPAKEKEIENLDWWLQQLKPTA